MVSHCNSYKIYYLQHDLWGPRHLLFHFPPVCSPLLGSSQTIFITVSPLSQALLALGHLHTLVPWTSILLTPALPMADSFTPFRAQLICYHLRKALSDHPFNALPYPTHTHTHHHFLSQHPFVSLRAIVCSSCLFHLTHSVIELDIQQNVFLLITCLPASSIVTSF